jgi:hypothetical protein
MFRAICGVDAGYDQFDIIEYGRTENEAMSRLEAVLEQTPVINTYYVDCVEVPDESAPEDRR